MAYSINSRRKYGQKGKALGISHLLEEMIVKPNDRTVALPYDC